ncbi:type I-U CRISPR-associated protein Cas5/Cas6 [Opitutaceae bacterium TAV3]|nr:type I-U CRISPR-associated protein Cas5/Cas6 [Opitutaceae bacterium TAV3]
MIYIKIDFPAGRWHATAWGSHVNEGVPEWPPCPWRLSRALIAAWHWKHRRQNETVLRALIDKLASAAPDYRLPQASAAHTRHYMPVVTGKNETKTKIFDTFVHVNKGESLWIRWDIALTPEEHTLLGTLLASLNYMGRAESLVIATLLDDSDTSPPSDTTTWTTPADTSPPPPPPPPRTTTAFERIRLLAPQEAAAYAQASAATQSASGKKSVTGKKKIASLPETLFDALQLDNADWKKEGRNLPPGSRWIEYTRPRDCFKIAPVKAPPPPPTTEPAHRGPFRSRLQSSALHHAIPQPRRTLPSNPVQIPWRRR